MTSSQGTFTSQHFLTWRPVVPRIQVVLCYILNTHLLVAKSEWTPTPSASVGSKFSYWHYYGMKVFSTLFFKCIITESTVICLFGSKDIDDIFFHCVIASSVDDNVLLAVNHNKHVLSELFHLILHSTQWCCDTYPFPTRLVQEIRTPRVMTQ